ncbi:polyhomeotic-like protein 1 [Coregonus clupeaformis]|uniref:polyhomeotic-like protein 1 n=1 Tax=Coregonus clupeaformis TaxID=59861 RepID=UPI001E1C9059|nr:polyhomeotic-like protein 1 [Coregonus clupeaformis]XP_041758694.2 polyhomeotic-like protein 1 [Coregonus clupeaformis]
MDAGDDQNTGSTNGNAPSAGNSRPPQIAHMSLYERQAVQALQALQRQPNAAQYFQQLMLQQQINSAQQLHNLAAVQQATLAASRQSNSPNHSVSQATTTVNLSTTSGGGTMTNPRPLGPATSVTSSALSQSVLLGGNSAGQGQMYLRVNRSLRAPLAASQLIFMPGGTATAAVATVAQQQPQPQQQQQQQEVPLTSNAQSDNDQVQNLALHCIATPRVAAVKTEFPDRKDAANYSLSQQQQQHPQQQQQQFSQNTQQQIQPQQQQMATKLTNYTHPTATGLPSMNVKTGNQLHMAPTAVASVPTSSSPSPTLPLSQLLLSPSGLCQARAVTTVTPAATVTHILVPTSNVPTSSQGYPIGSVAPKTNVNTQTLVVQPLQQSNTNMDKVSHSSGPVHIQPKTSQGHRLPVQLPPRHPPPILPAPSNNSQPNTGGHHPPHVPVQLVGARQGSVGNSQALAQARSCCPQDNGTATASTGGNTMAKPAIGSLKRKSETDATNAMAVEPSQLCCPPMRDSAPPLSPAPTLDSAPKAVPAFSSPPTLSLPLPLSRGVGGQGDRAPLPQAVVKPQVLTHLIEGFVIQEGAEPFPVTGPVKEPLAMGVQQADNGGPAVLKCEYCESFAPASQFRGSKRFCSKTCAKRYNVSCSHHFQVSRGRASARPPGPPVPPDSIVRRRGPRRSSSEIACAKIAGRHLPVKECRSESSRSEDVSSCDGEEEEEDSPSLSPSSSLSCPRPAHCDPHLDDSAQGSLPLDEANFLSGSPAHWGVEEVCKFISSLQGCEELAAQFLSQEIDGQALLLLREEHLISTMNIKLGPALKICASINSLRD